MASGILSEMVQADFRDFKPELAVLPVGATEVHGLHLPYGCDARNLDYLTAAAVRSANEEGGSALMLPALPYGIDTNLMEFPYTVTLSARTLMSVVSDLIESMAHHGVRKFLMVNGHGGNASVLETVCRELSGRPIFVAMVNWWTMVSDVVEEVIETPPDHACEFETSVCLAIEPGLVRMDLARESPTRKSRLEALERYGGKFSRAWHHYTLNGGTGHSEKATRGKGERIVTAAVARLKEVILELCRRQYDERFPF